MRDLYYSFPTKTQTFAAEKYLPPMRSDGKMKSN